MPGCNGIFVKQRSVDGCSPSPLHHRRPRLTHPSLGPWGSTITAKRTTDGRRLQTSCPPEIGNRKRRRRDGGGLICSNESFSRLRFMMIPTETVDQRRIC
ncbi:dentin sialoph s in 41 species: Archae - 0 [Striga asiatica]|uniref:Dentin sialoph s in 41 species: Archae-0 n=1 Tax=Striga asiatica TaxID=4170 RepID=A0A5A7Q3V0_STRAF|nr:dentin sialoph s in 41 species: Archae - 0 [Striga asiatica]